MKNAFNLIIFTFAFFSLAEECKASVAEIKTGSDTIYINENQFKIKNIQAYSDKMYIIPFENRIVLLNAVGHNIDCRCGQLRNNMLYRIYSINFNTHVRDSIDLDSSSRDFTRLRKLNDFLFYFSYYDSSSCKSIDKTHASRETIFPDDVDDVNLYLIEHFYIYSSQLKLVDSFSTNTNMNARVFNAKYREPIENIRMYGYIYNGIFDLPLEAEIYDELKRKYKPLLKYIPAVIKEECFYQFDRFKMERTGWSPVHNTDNIFFFPNYMFESEYKRRNPKEFLELGKIPSSTSYGKKMLYINDTLRKDFFKEHDSDITLAILHNKYSGDLLSVRLCGGVSMKKPTYMELSLTSRLSVKKIKLPMLTEFFSITTFTNGNIEFLDRFSKDGGILIYNKNLNLIQKITDENTFLTSYQPLGSFEIDGNPYNRKIYSQEDFDNEAKLLHVKRNENHVAHKYHFNFPEGFQALTAFYQDGYGVFVVKNYTTGMVDILYDKTEKIFGK